MSCRHPRSVRIYKDGGYTCSKCDHFVSRESIRRGVNARKRGNRLQAQAAKDAGITNIGMMGLPEDAGLSTEWLVLQHKSGNGYPKLLDRWLRALTATADQLRAVVYTETPGPGKKARRLIIMDYDEFVSWFGTNGAETCDDCGMSDGLHDDDVEH